MMEFIFFDDKDKILFVRSDAESANWTVEELSLTAEFPYDEFREIQRGQRIAFEDDTGILQPFEIRKVESMEPDHYQRLTAEHIAISELTDEHCQAVALTDTTAQTALEGLLAGSLWRVGNVTTTGTSSADIATGSVWQAVRTIETNWNVYITPRVTFDSTGITGRFLDISPAEGVWRGVRLSIDKNADEIGVTYDDTNVITAMYGYGRSIAEAARTLWPVNFSIINPGHVMIVSGGAISVQAAQDWTIYRYAFPQRTTFSLQELLKNAAVDNVAVAAYELNQTYYPIDPENTGDVITADAIAINCRKNTIIDAGTPVTYAPSQFTIRYAGHAFMGDEHGIPTVVEAPGWDMLYIPLDQPTTLRLDALQSNELGVYDMFYEMGGTYYPLGADNPGVIFTAEELLINRHTTTTTESDTHRTITPPTGFTRLRNNEAFMGNDAGEPTFVSADGWEVWRLPLTAGQTIRLDSMAANDALGGVYPMGYESGGEYLPLWPDDATGEFQADALLVNCKRTESISGETWTPISLTPANFSTIALNNAALMQNGDTMSVAFENGWSIRQWNFDTRRKFKISNAPQTLAGVVTVAYVRNNTYYPIDLSDATKEYEGDALVINALEQTVWIGDQAQSIIPNTQYWNLIYPNKAFMNEGGGPTFADRDNWDVYEFPLTAGQSIRLDELVRNNNLRGVYPAGFKQGGGYFPLDLSERGQIFQADAIIVNCLRTQAISGGTWTDSDIGASFTQNVFDGGALMQNGDQAYVQMAPDWSILRHDLGGRRRIKIKSYTANPNTAGTAVVALERDSTYYPINLEDLTTEYEADALVINRRKMTVSSWGSYTYSYTGFSRYRDDTALMNDGSGGVYYQPAENWRVYRRAFDKRTRIKCTSITQNSSLSGVTVAAYEVGGNLYTLSASSTTEIECDAILINCHVGGFPVTLTPPDGFSDYTVDHNQVMEINPNGQSVYTPNTAWNTPRYELSKWTDIRIDSVIYNEQVQGVYAIGCWTGDLHVIRQEEIDAKTVFNASSIKVNYLKTTAQYAATQITYTPNPNTLYFSATSISIQAYETNEIYAYSATSLVISRYNNDGTIVTNRAWSYADMTITPNMRQATTTSYSTSGVSGSYSNNDGTPVTTRDYSLASATITPNIRHITSYAYSMSTATLTPVTVTETHDYSMDHLTYVPTAGATGSASQTFADVVWDKADGDPANKPEGQTYVIDETATAIYGRNGRPRWGYYQNGNVSDPETLLALTWRSLQQTNKPRVSIDMLVHDLYRLGYADQPIRLHDIAIVEVKPIGVELMLEIVRLSVDLLDPTGTRPTIGTYIPNIVYINRETAFRASGGGRGGGGNGRGQTAAQKELSEFETEISANNYQISLRAYQRDMDNVSDILRQAGLSIDANGVLVYAEDNANMWASRLKVESDRISLVVTGTGANAHVNPASIITAINNNKSSVRINADQIILSGDVTIAGILTGQTRAKHIQASTLQAMSYMNIASAFSFRGRSVQWKLISYMDGGGKAQSGYFMVPVS